MDGSIKTKLFVSVWQQPYVNVFKHFNVSQWKKASKEGEVSSVMDKTVKATVFKITGHIPAGNYIQLPRTGSQPLGLTGRYFYLLFCPIPTKYFVVHVDVATQDSLVIRLSFSNLFKEFKSTATWLQFPFLCNPAKGSVDYFAAVGGRGKWLLLLYSTGSKSSRIVTHIAISWYGWLYSV